MKSELRSTSSSNHTCQWCNMSFPRLSQLVSHFCQSMRDGEEESSGTRRRKGRPRKLTDTESSNIDFQTAKEDCHNDNAYVKSLQGNVPNMVIMSSDNPQQTNGMQKQLSLDLAEIDTLTMNENMTPLDFNDLGIDCAESKNVTLNLKRGRGRPKGSKNKSAEQPETKPARRRLIYTCKYCSKTFSSSEQHLIHEAQHTNSQPFPCTWEGCNKAFNSKFKFERHQMVHTKPSKYV